MLLYSLIDFVGLLVDISGQCLSFGGRDEAGWNRVEISLFCVNCLVNFLISVIYAP